MNTMGSKGKKNKRLITENYGLFSQRESIQYVFVWFFQVTYA